MLEACRITIQVAFIKMILVASSQWCETAGCMLRASPQVKAHTVPMHMHVKQCVSEVAALSCHEHEALHFACQE